MVDLHSRLVSALQARLEDAQQWRVRAEVIGREAEADREIHRVEAYLRVCDDYKRALAGCKEHPEDFALKGALLALHGVIAHLAAGEGIEVDDGNS